MTEFKIEDVTIETFTYGMYGNGLAGRDGYRMKHKPTGWVILAIGNPRLKNESRMQMMEALRKRCEKSIKQNS